MYHLKTIAIIAISCFVLQGCDMLNCTDATASKFTIEVYDSTGTAVTILDTLSVTACGTDSVLLNRSVNTSSLSLPMSYVAQVDTFVISVKDSVETVRDTLFVDKTNEQFFESPDCPTRFFHTINNVLHNGEFIDSVKILDTKVNFMETTHLRIYIH